MPLAPPVTFSQAERALLPVCALLDGLRLVYGRQHDCRVRVAGFMFLRFFGQQQRIPQQLHDPLRPGLQRARRSHYLQEPFCLRVSASFRAPQRPGLRRQFADFAHPLHVIGDVAQPLHALQKRFRVAGRRLQRKSQLKRLRLRGRGSLCLRARSGGTSEQDDKQPSKPESVVHNSSTVMLSLV